MEFLKNCFYLVAIFCIIALIGWLLILIIPLLIPLIIGYIVIDIILRIIGYIMVELGY